MSQREVVLTEGMCTSERSCVDRVDAEVILTEWMRKSERSVVTEGMCYVTEKLC